MRTPTPLEHVEQVPWAPRADESPAEFTAFQVWLTAGPSRPVPSSALASLRGWSTRAKAYDDYVLAVPDAPGPDVSVRRHLAALALMGQLMRSELVKHYAQSTASSAPLVPFADLVRSMKIVVELEKLLTDGSNVGENATAVDLSRLTDEEIVLLDRLTRKAANEH